MSISTFVSHVELMCLSWVVFHVGRFFSFNAKRGVLKKGGWFGSCTFTQLHHDGRDRTFLVKIGSGWASAS